MKPCVDCGDIEAERYAGVAHRCKTCHRAVVTARRNAKIEEVRAYDQRRGRLPGRIAKTVATNARRRQEVPGRMRAHSAVSRAIAKGTLVRQPCGVCADKRSHAHHDSYLPGDELKVRWLCPAHHAQWHRDHPEMK